jgi:uncharacterized protein YecE (DUF72 family)
MSGRERVRTRPEDRRTVRVGCSGWSYEDWRGRLYPKEGSTSGWLARYAEVFDTVEVNATFYRLPTRTAAERWASATPEDFCFAVKASRYLTHVRRLRELPEGIRRLAGRIEPLVSSGKLGPVLWQLPATFRRDDERLASALAELPPGRHAFEFRHPSWFTADVERLLHEHDVALVIGDDPRRPFQAHELTADWTLVRLHHGRRGRRGNYSRRELEEWAGRIRRWRRKGEVFVYLNNDWEGFAVENARLLKLLLRRSPGG